MLAGKWTDKKILWTSTVFYFITLLMKINYTYDKEINDVWYLVSSTLFFCATLISESITTAILSKIISKKKAISFWNAGLLSGLADTFGRAVGSSFNTVFAKVASVNAVPCLMYSIYAGICLIFLIIMFVQWERMEICYYYEIITKEGSKPSQIVDKQVQKNDVEETYEKAQNIDKEVQEVEDSEK